MSKCNVLPGQVFNKFTVLSKVITDSPKNSYWNCYCSECCKHVVKRSTYLDRDCKCLREPKPKKSKQPRLKIVHDKALSKVCAAWHGMKTRCFNKNIAGYKHYGGRGITVCEEWVNSFEQFFKDMGFAPSDEHSLDRIKNDGNYEPSNCRWATRKEQVNNTRQNVLLTYQDKTLSVAVWCQILNLTYRTILARVNSGWTAEKALTKPIIKKNKSTVN